jgi:hypothetical protein
MSWGCFFVRLAEVSSIRVGASARGRLEAVEVGEDRVLQAGQLGSDGCIDSARLIQVADRFGKDAPRLEEGDVVLQTRGVNYPVAVAGANVTGAVVVAPLCLIRPLLGQIHGPFLAELLAHPRIQARLRAAAAGTYVPELTRETIANFDIPLPAMPHQRALTALGEQIRRERTLLERLAAAQDSLLFGLIEQAAKAPGGVPTSPGERRSAGVPTPAGLASTPSL